MLSITEKLNTVIDFLSILSHDPITQSKIIKKQQNHEEKNEEIDLEERSMEEKDDEDLLEDANIFLSNMETLREEAKERIENASEKLASSFENDNTEQIDNLRDLYGRILIFIADSHSEIQTCMKYITRLEKKYPIQENDLISNKHFYYDQILNGIEDLVNAMHKNIMLETYNLTWILKYPLLNGKENYKKYLELLKYEKTIEEYKPCKIPISIITYKSISYSDELYPLMTWVSFEKNSALEIYVDMVYEEENYLLEPDERIRMHNLLTNILNEKPLNFNIMIGYIYTTEELIWTISYNDIGNGYKKSHIQKLLIKPKINDVDQYDIIKKYINSLEQEIIALKNIKEL